MLFMASRLCSPSPLLNRQAPAALASFPGSSGLLGQETGYTPTYKGPHLADYTLISECIRNKISTSALGNSWRDALINWVQGRLPYPRAKTPFTETPISTEQGTGFLRLDKYWLLHFTFWKEIQSLFLIMDSGKVIKAAQIRERNFPQSSHRNIPTFWIVSQFLFSRTLSITPPPTLPWWFSILNNKDLAGHQRRLSHFNSKQGPRLQDLKSERVRIKLLPLEVFALNLQ